MGKVSFERQNVAINEATNEYVVEANHHHQYDPIPKWVKEQSALLKQSRLSVSV